MCTINTVHFVNDFNSISCSSEGMSLPPVNSAGFQLTQVDMRNSIERPFNFTQGKLSGMANWTRWGEAKLETKCILQTLQTPVLFSHNFLLDVIEFS